MLFERLQLIIDELPHAAALNMAADEVLLRNLRVPVLRIYQWESPAVSFGYFERYAPVKAQYPDREPVRRWTGGGVVPHGGDFTYSLLAPAGDPLARMAAPVTYRLIHEALGKSLNETGIPVFLAGSDAATGSTLCFEKPVRHDLLRGGSKIAGAAQRRTRFGLLHQGSIQAGDLPEGFVQRLAAQMSPEIFEETIPEELWIAAEKLAGERYGSLEWLEKF